MSVLDEPAALARFRQAVLVGTGPGGAGDLTPLSWLSARGRFSRAPAPDLAPGPLWPDDARAIVPEAARAPLRLLLTGRDARADGPYARRIAQELRQRGLRLHPYDLKSLESFVGRHAARLGRHAQAWLAIVRPAQSDIRETYAEEVEALNEQSFASASRAEKLAFLRGRRVADPAAARALIEARLDDEPAVVRAGMVGVLEVGLGADDAALLDRLAEDKAASVREAAAAMLARLPSSAAYEARKRDAASWLELKSKGLLGRTRVLQVKPPAKLPPERIDAALAAAFEGLALADMAAPFGLPLAEFAAAARADWRAARLVLSRAVREDRPDLVAILAEPDGVAGDDMVAAIAAALSSLPPARRAAMVAAGVRPGDWAALPPRPALEALQDALEAPWPEATAAALLRGAAWAQALERWAAEDRAAPDLVEVLAASMPEAAAPAFLAAIEPLPAGLKRGPRLLFDCLKTFPASRGAAS